MKIAFLAIAIIVGNFTSLRVTAQQRNIDLEIKIRMATILMQGDTSGQYGTQLEDGQLSLLFTLHRPEYGTENETIKMVRLNRVMRFVRAFLFPVHDTVFDFFGFALDSLKTPPFEGKQFLLYDNNEFAGGQVSSRKERLNLLLDVIPYQVTGHCSGTEDIHIYFALPQPRMDALDQEFYTIFVIALFKFVAEGKLHKLTFHFVNEKDRQIEITIDDHFRRFYKELYTLVASRISEQARSW
ncbi:MAG TPA: hypothetical protein VJU78_07845 [Chitinophagaceae bacterium]|nr:hypothetical protein [Chitinophagaceae bacterium]